MKQNLGMNSVMLLAPEEETMERNPLVILWTAELMKVVKQEWKNNWDKT